MNRDCNGDFYAIKGRRFYRCLADSSIVDIEDSNSSMVHCPHCHRVIGGVHHDAVLVRRYEVVEVTSRLTPELRVACRSLRDRVDFRCDARHAAPVRCGGRRRWARGAAMSDWAQQVKAYVDEKCVCGHVRLRHGPKVGCVFMACECVVFRTPSEDAEYCARLAREDFGDR